jgi:hypothetical protein
MITRFLPTFRTENLGSVSCTWAKDEKDMRKKNTASGTHFIPVETIFSFSIDANIKLRNYKA